MTLTHNDEGRVSATLDLDGVTGEELLAALTRCAAPSQNPTAPAMPAHRVGAAPTGSGQLLRDYLSGSTSTRPLSGGVLPTSR
ncbi:MAG: hypothetical protein H6523_08135 [Mycolicibacterium sp.]|nr:hypothetical protein [Mycolicibacterium sp.]